ncbi:MAG TPA: hypothetical protein VFW10_04330, partial [Steroidobacteraceae bacterium]|nr:hypothetical protein [Steroidobacteraceae bacterium]
RLDVALTLRVYKMHGIIIRYRVSNRDGHYSHLPDSHQRVGTVNIGYTFIGDGDLGAVDWRPGTGQ